MIISKILLVILISFSFTDDKQIYSTIQMMDQVMIIDPISLQIEESLSTEFVIENVSTCIDYTLEMDCNMAGGCEWMMNMCMESSSQSCMDYSIEMECNMADECEWMMDMCMENPGSNTMNTPHFIVLDETNGYWFVTTITSGFIAQYSLIDNVFIDSFFVGDAPALLAIDEINKKIYCSRMMPMNGMGNMMPSSDSNIIQSLSYSSMGLELSNVSEYIIGSPAPHGLAINSYGNEIFTASNTADWIYKINLENGEITGAAMDEEVNNTPDQITQRLKPIQCLSVSNKLFVTCSAGPWMNPWSGQTTIIEGKLQMWDSDLMTLIDSIDLGEYSSPWHIKESPIDEVVYVVLGGDNLYDTEGLACVRYENNELVLEWIIGNENFDTLHGVDVSSDGQRIYVSGRGDGKIHVFDNQGNYIDYVSIGTMSMLGGIALEKKGLPELGDLNNNVEINVVDVVLLVNSIFSPMMSSPYQNYASDFNEDEDINVVDIVNLVSNILDN